MKILKVGLTLLLIFSFVSVAFADGEVSSSPAKPFFSSVLYGTVAGTLIGAATLAFTSDPGDNLSNIARGASLGLYAGIILGLYLTYGVGDSQDSNPPPPQTQNSIKKEKPIQVSVTPVIDSSILGANLSLHF